MRKIIMKIFMLIIIFFLCLPANNLVTEIKAEEGKVNVFVLVSWEDNNDQYGVRPSFTYVSLLSSDVQGTVQWAQLTGLYGWSHTFSNISANFDANGQLTTQFTIDAYPPTEDYTHWAITNNTYNQESKFVIIYVLYYLAPRISIAASVGWDDNNNQDGLRPDSISEELYCQETDTTVGADITVANDWKHTFDKNGGFIKWHQQENNPYTYVISEYTVAGYENPDISVADNAATKEFTIKYKRTPATTSKKINLVWDDNNSKGERPANITIRLLKNNVQIDTRVVGELEGWSGDFVTYEKYQDGVLVVYKITEDSTAGYRIKVNGYNVTNTRFKGAPNTGDDFNIGLWIGLMALSFVALVGVVVYQYRNKRRK
ncbi:MAG: Cna B-type domain-containing protein [Erysipelotrichaceae bacterium]|jgi:hypothetical protein